MARPVKKCRLGISTDEYTRIGKAFRDAADACRREYSGAEQKICIRGVGEVVDAMNKIGFWIPREKA